MREGSACEGGVAGLMGRVADVASGSPQARVPLRRLRLAPCGAAASCRERRGLHRSRHSGVQGAQRALPCGPGCHAWAGGPGRWFAKGEPARTGSGLVAGMGSRRATGIEPPAYERHLQGRLLSGSSSACVRVEGWLTSRCSWRPRVRAARPSVAAGRVELAHSWSLSAGQPHEAPAGGQSW